MVDPIANWNGSKDKLKEIEKQKEVGYREQDSAETALRLNTPENTETSDTKQNGQQQRNEGAAYKHYNLFIICFWFFLGNEITTYRYKTKDIIC